MSLQLDGAIAPLRSAVNAFAITPSDTVDLPFPTRGIYVGVAGHVTLVTLSGDQVLFKTLAAGVVHGIAARRVLSTGTAATDIVGLY